MPEKIIQERITNFEKNTSLLLGIGALFINFSGIIGASLSNRALLPDDPKAFFFRVLPVTVVFILNIILFKIFYKQHKERNFIYASALINGYLLFPFMLLKIGIPFLSYYYILAVYSGLTVAKAKHLLPFIPVLVLGNLAIFFNPTMSNTLMIGFPVVFAFNLIMCAKYYSAFSFERKRILENEKLLADLASKDELTGLYNRRTLDLDIEKLNFKCGIMFDIDHFKHINDTYGHQIGDKALQDLAKILLRHCSNEFMAYRYGGEEFFVLTRFEKDFATQILGKIFDDIRKNFIIEGLPVTVSAGMSAYENVDAMKMIRDADANLYQAKKNGRDRAYIDGIPYFVVESEV